MTNNFIVLFRQFGPISEGVTQIVLSSSHRSERSCWAFLKAQKNDLIGSLFYTSFGAEY
jgi:hypothetical protein